MRRPLFVAVVLALALAGVAASSFRGGSRPAGQPIAFDHARHQKEDLACVDCHKTVERSPYASLPRIATCLLCHEEQKGEHPDEPKIREYAEKKEEIPWLQVNRLPGHVYFSHAMHVKLGKMECAACHGNMAERTAPVTESQIEDLSMGRCMECHRESGASNDCLACHK